MMMSPDFRAILSTNAENLGAQADAQILAFFGSEENFMAYKDIYVLEETTLRLDTQIDPDSNIVTYRAETEMRIRPKTLAELEADEKHG